MTQTQRQTQNQAQARTQAQATVRAVNRLTTRWAAHAASGTGGTVFTAAGVWPLLALLADGAGGPARAELAQALGIPAEDAAGAARELLAALAGVRGLSAATGLWAAAGLPLEEGWSAKLPPGARGTLTGDLEGDTKALDGWASERTGGLIERMPVTLRHDTRLVLASALALALKWAEAFREFPGHVPDGPWAGRGLRRLFRTTASLDPVRVAEGPTGPVTALEVTGAVDMDMDVHLLLGTPAAPAADVLATGIAAVSGALPAPAGNALPDGSPGPGLTIATVDAFSPQPQLSVSTVAFSLSAEHDLLEDAALFGLLTATAEAHGHFPGISAEPLAIGSARQSAMARFHAEGFEAAAVTAIAARPGGAARRPSHRARRAEVRFDRPFGFLAVHRNSGLVLAAGWVTDPESAVQPRPGAAGPFPPPPFPGVRPPAPPSH
ncbi:serpin family protein [Streptomyces sp. A0592]|uniref:serpin family protein n=1 Tax=Streptomyces sp. A0592 TaxID=2563099 RepID=UPI00109E8BF4|nr:serpin family protein [Streptomyces sp. A0592]THA86800.1 proteinase inhibitor I4 serpin [Streptomyces sp. A0592]